MKQLSAPRSSRNLTVSFIPEVETEPSRIKLKNILSEPNRTESRMSKNRIEPKSNLFLSQPNRIESNSNWTIRLEKLYIYTLLLGLPPLMILLCHFLSISVKKRSALCFSSSTAFHFFVNTYL